MPLISKLTLTIGLVLALVMTPFTYAKLKTLRALMVEQAVASADHFGETILRTTHSEMLENDRLKVYRAIREVGNQEGVDHIRMIRKDGTIIFSTEAREIGTQLDKKAAACNMCHAGRKPLVAASSMNRSRLFQGPGGKSLLGLSKAVYNQRACWSAECHFHPEDQEILGVLDVILSLEPMHAQLASYRNTTVLATVAMLGLIAAILVVFLRRLVHDPVQALLSQTEQVGRGNLDASVDTVSTDELGELSRAFNTMTQSLKKARSELEDLAHNLESKVEERTREVRQMQTQLVRSEKLASLGELVAGIAHELNNPLTGILVFSSLLSGKPGLDEASKSDIDVIVHETKRCATIVKGLLEFSRESIPTKQPCSINDIMEKTLSLIGHQSFFHDIAIHKHYREEMPPTLADPNQLEQVFINMLLNASQAMAGHGDLTLRTGVTSDSRWAYVEVEDTGCGIPDEHLPKIFDPFFTTKESKGTGLGLSVSYGIVQNHGGRIEVQSTVGVGTIFSVLLPLNGHAPSEVAA